MRGLEEQAEFRQVIIRGKENPSRSHEHEKSWSEEKQRALRV